MWTKEKLWELRQEIKLCSLFYNDYENSFELDTHPVCDFFDGYADYLWELMEENGQKNMKYFWDLLPDYDTPDNLWCWYLCFEDEPLKTKEDIA